MSKPSLREDLLNAGLKVMFRSGYTAASVRDICEAAGVPLGSFTNHFRSKEAFAQEVLDRYFAGTKQFVKQALDDKSLTPRQRLKRYLDIISGVAADRKWNLGCLIGETVLDVRFARLAEPDKVRRDAMRHWSNQWKDIPPYVRRGWVPV